MRNTITDKALNFATEAHKGQKRKFTDVDYIVHPIETANILWEATNHKISDDSIIAALLHDVVEDTSKTFEDIENNFGTPVKDLVFELTSVKKEIKIMGKKYYLLNKLNHMSNNAFSIKLADRLSNVGDLTYKKTPNQFVKSYSIETTFLLEKIDREINELQSRLIESITKVLLFLTLNRSIRRLTYSV